MPKSRGRRKPGGGKKPVRRSPHPLRLSDRVLREARTLHLEDRDVLAVEAWASGCLGEAWLAAGMMEREPEQTLCLEVVGRASTTPSPHGLAAVAALERVGPPDSRSMLGEAVEILAGSQPLPAWHAAAPHRPVRAWRAVDVWDSERVLFVEYGGPVPHTLMAQINEVGGTMVDKLALLTPAAAEAWAAMREDGEMPMPPTEQDAVEVLADLALALRLTDMTWPRQDDEDVVALRALAWARCRDHLPDWPEHQPLGEAERTRLLDAFTAFRTDAAQEADTVRSLADLFLDYGENYLSRGPLCWSPGQVAGFLEDWLPRKAVLDQEHRMLLPAVLTQWVTFALTERGVEEPWISPVIAAVDAYASAFRAAFDDEEAWGPAKQISAALAARGIDLTDRDAVDAAVRNLNAEQLARQLTDRPRPSGS
ncbi:hypothetical protein [Streptomyces sasae]|uniref:hypothetical protein n=1 Tax=Streptomyces sasae TaxID=1266772 RepID=UPI002930002B|nr:hypothetical protein [Streptomyces sasae]